LPTLVGGHELFEEIARGGMGVIYKAREIALDRVVAFKMILDSELGTKESVERFHREARAAAALDHPNIVPVYHSGEHEGRHFFTMAYVEGATLKETVHRDGLPSPHHAVGLLLAVADAVEFAHRKNILHRDLKPENVLIDQQGRPRVTDFGLAKRVDADPVLTGSGQVLGTPCYLPPEQALGDAARIGPASDVYGLGGILYFLLTGRPPFQGETTTEVLSQVLVQPPTPPRQHNPHVAEGLEAICLKCLDKEPGKRYPSAAALSAALKEWASQAKTASPLDTLTATPQDEVVAMVRSPSWKDPETAPPSAGPRYRPGGQSRRRWAALAAVGCLVVAAGVWGWLHFRPPPPPPPEPDTTPVVNRTPKDRRNDFGLDLIPKDRRNDFGLGVEMVGGQPGPDGVIRLRDGDTVKFRVKVEQEAYVGIWTLEADGTIIQLFPNDKDQNHRFRAGEERLVPQRPVVDTEPSRGLDRVWILASTAPWPSAEDLVRPEGAFLRLKNLAEQEAWAKRLRGFRLRREVRLADKVLQYQVGPAR
jgi:serine/threonine protein kinase